MHTPHIEVNVLFEAYRAYFDTPSQSNASSLFDAILSYDFEDYADTMSAIYEAYNKFRGLDGPTLYSNGTSTRTSHGYKFGPNCDFWLEQIECFIKLTDGVPIVRVADHEFGPIVFVDNDVRLYNQNVPEIKRLKAPPYRFSLGVDFAHHPIESLSLFEESIKNTTERINIASATPNVFLYLFAHQKIQTNIVESGMVHSLASTGWEAVYKKQWIRDSGLQLNDNMVDWSTGVNFWTCKYSRKHFLPIFHQADNRVCNLLNLCSIEGRQIQDLVAMGPRLRCECGRWTIPIDSFVPHVAYSIRLPSGEIWHDTNIIEMLEGVYRNIQFIQIGNCIVVKYIAEEVVDADQLRLIDYFSRLGFEVRFREGRTQIGWKSMPFWNSGQFKCL